jgi:hypothetical protein
MAIANLIDERTDIISGKDNIVIVDVFQSVRGGRTLDVTGFERDVINAGHVIIRETATGNHKPMPVSADNGIATLGTPAGGSGYTNGTYNVLLQGGSGSGATANVTVGSGAVTGVTLVTAGKNYKAGDTLTAAITGGSGFSVTAATVASAAYETLPDGHTYAGILIASIPSKRPFAGILVRGTVNPAAAPFPMDSILSAVKTALPLIDFRD